MPAGQRLPMEIKKGLFIAYENSVVFVEDHLASIAE